MNKLSKNFIAAAFIIIGITFFNVTMTTGIFSVADKNMENATFYLIQKSNAIINLLFAICLILLANFFKKND